MGTFTPITFSSTILEFPPREDPPPADGLELREVRRYGDTALAFYFRSPGSTP